MHRRFVKKRDYEKISVKLKLVGPTAHYTGSYEDLEFEGDTVGNDVDIRNVLSRMLTAEKDTPEKLKSLVSLVVGYVELMVNSGVWFVVTYCGYEFRGDCSVGIKVSAVYDTGEADGDDDYVGWVVTLRAYFEGFDGLSYEARHEVKKTIRPGENVDFDAMRDELAYLVKIAYNAYKGGPGRATCE
jgi:hypothetical protein